MINVRVATLRDNSIYPTWRLLRWRLFGGDNEDTEHGGVRDKRQFNVARYGMHACAVWERQKQGGKRATRKARAKKEKKRIRDAYSPRQNTLRDRFYFGDLLIGHAFAQSHPPRTRQATGRVARVTTTTNSFFTWFWNTRGESKKSKQGVEWGGEKMRWWHVMFLPVNETRSFRSTVHNSRLLVHNSECYARPGKKKKNKDVTRVAPSCPGTNDDTLQGGTT